MKITVITPLFAMAGVPLAQVRFASALSARGHDVELIIGKINKGFSYSPRPEFKTSVLHCNRTLSMLLPIIRHFRVQKPDVIFSAEDHLNILVLLAAWIAGVDSRISGSSRVTPFDTYSDIPLTKRWVLKQLARVLMPRAHALTCVSQDMVGQYQQVFAKTRHTFVYNIVVDQQSRKRMLEPTDHPWLLQKDIPVLVAAGRLAPWKGFAHLIDAVALLQAKRAVRLLILGDGPLHKELQRQIEELGLAGSIQLHGYVENPLKYFSRANVFVLSSVVEGLPNVLVEAMMCGCTPVSTDCPTGPREVLQGGKYGYLVPIRDPNAMADAILYALDHPIPKKLLDEAVQPFEESRVIARHFELLGLAG